MVAGGREGDGAHAVTQRDDADLRSVQALLDEHEATRVVPVQGMEHLAGGLDRCRPRAEHRDALARRQAVLLDDEPGTRPDVPLDRGSRGLQRLAPLDAGHRDAGARRDLVAERLARLDPRGRRRGAEGGDPGGLQGVDDAGGQRRLRTDDDELDGQGPGQLDDRLGSAIPRRDDADAWLLGDAVAAGRDEHIVDAGLDAQLPGQGVLATTAAHDQDPGRHREAPGAHAGIPGRWRIGRHARSIVWVRSGPTDTSTTGTPAWASMADT